MKKKNPLYWDLQSLPEEMFQSRALARYRKDIDARKRLKRGAVKGTIGHLPRKGSQSTWLPSANLFVIPITALYALGMPSDYKHEFSTRTTDRMRAWVRSNTFQIQQELGATNPNDIVYILNIQNIVSSVTESLTPFMLLHDIGEDLENVGLSTSFEPIIMNLGAFYSDCENPLYEGKLAYLPKLVHVQPIPERPKTHNTVAFYITDSIGDPDRNYASDLWALWCKKEKLTPNQFWPIETIIEFIRNRYAPNTEKSYCWTQIDPEQYCDLWNCYFTKILAKLKGQVILGTEIQDD